MELQYLICPQLLSEDALREILNDRCIEVPNLKSMDKIKLLEIFRRVAMPLPQRIYNEDKLLGKKMKNLRLSRNLSISNYDNDINLSTTLSDASETDKKSASTINSSTCGRLKPPINDKLMQKRIRLCNNTDESKIHEDNLHDIKRKCEVSLQTDSKKRQKITWP